MDEPILLSALQHFEFCPRQCALIHLEHEWSENTHTTRGQQTHERAHSGQNEERSGMRTLRALPLTSRRYGLVGVSDVVELHGGQPVPVEYKSGRAKPRLADEVQLCAQAICLEEMFGTMVSSGFIYHAGSHKRREVLFTPELRAAVLTARDGVRALLRSGVLPPPAADDRCRLCSLFDECEPFAPRSFPPGYDPFSMTLGDR